jgi:hypothetical protein
LCVYSWCIHILLYVYIYAHSYTHTYITFFYSFISCWVLRLTIRLGYGECAVISRGMQVSLLYVDLHSFGFMTKNGRAGSHSIDILFFEELPYLFPLWLHLHKFPLIAYEGSFPPHTRQHLILFVFMVIAILTGL